MAQTYKIKFVFGDEQECHSGAGKVITISSNKTSAQIENAISTFGDLTEVELYHICSARHDHYVDPLVLAKIIKYAGDTPIGTGILGTLVREGIPEEITVPSEVINYAIKNRRGSFYPESIEDFHRFVMACARAFLPDLEWCVVTEEYDGTIYGLGGSFF
jgi:hypothetical protein